MFRLLSEPSLVNQSIIVSVVSQTLNEEIMATFISKKTNQLALNDFLI